MFTLRLFSNILNDISIQLNNINEILIIDERGIYDR